MKSLFTYFLPLIILCIALWFALSGLLSPLFLLFGTCSIALSVWFAARARFADAEEQNFLRASRMLLYFPWLFWQIIKSNIEVSIRILRGNDTISPVMFPLPISLSSESGRTLYAQSITLTPGTVTAIVYHEQLLIHALSHESMEDLLKGNFEKPALWYEGSANWRGEIIHRPTSTGDTKT